MMKRYIHILTLLLAVMSCNSKINPDTTGTIVVTASVNGHTKAGYDDGNLPMNIVMDINQNTDKYNYSWVELEKNASNNQYEAKVPLRWASDDRTGVTIMAMTLPFGEPSIGKNPMAVSVSQDQNLRENLEASDLLGASIGNGVTIDGDKVKVAFNHLLSKLHVFYEFDSDFGGSQITVNSIVVKNICIAGGYNYAMMGDGSDSYSTVDLEYGNITMYHNSNTAEAIFYPYMPSTAPTLVMNVTIDGVEYQFTCPIVLKVSDSFEGGKRYNLYVKIVGSSVNGTSFSITTGWDTISDEWDFIADDLNYVNLSERGTANSYIVSTAGKYYFSPTKGNSCESVGDINNAVVLWETFGTDAEPSVGDLITNVKFENGLISFETPFNFTEGNAVIAAKDAAGKILWSWHIWLTDQPEGQVYFNDAGTMMDRNLGATSTMPGDVGALGLLYQWGRKDPFLGSSSISESIVAKSTITWPSSVVSNSDYGTIEYATANPTVFITRNGNNSDWLYSDDKTNDYTRWESNKAVYDPCPYGWRVPDGGDDGVWATADNKASISYDNSNKGINFSGEFGASPIIWYPSSGLRNGDSTGQLQIGSANAESAYWSCSPHPNFYGYALTLKFTNNTSLKSSGCIPFGLAVRCIKDSNDIDE